MDEKYLPIDRTKHLVYSKGAKKIIENTLARGYEAHEAAVIFEEMQRIYADSMKDIVYMGGSKNSQAQSVYDCAAFFAFYEAVPHKPSLMELEHMNDGLFLPPFSRLGKAASLNCPLLLNAAQKIYMFLDKRGREKAQQWPGNYLMETEPLADDRCIRYKFHRCPIAELAKKRGLTAIMPAFCNSDYIMLRAVHAVLVRTSTCAFGPYCDYLIAGDKNPAVKDYSPVRNKEGYLINTSSPYDII